MKQLIKIGKRRCCVCKLVLELNKDFYRNKSQNGGFSYECKSCTAEKNRIWRSNPNNNPNQKRLNLRFQIFQRDNFTCQYCGRKAPDVILEADHVNPKSNGGKNIYDNYITACRDCNRGKRDMILSKV